MGVSLVRCAWVRCVRLPKISAAPKALSDALGTVGSAGTNPRDGARY